MREALHLVIAYSLGAVLLSSIDVTYEWFDPLISETGESTDWCFLVGLKIGAIGVVHHYGGFADGLVMDLHVPQFLPLPFFAGTGPDSGGVAIAVWFLAAVAWIIHSLLRLRTRRFRDTQLSTPEK